MLDKYSERSKGEPGRREKRRVKRLLRIGGKAIRKERDFDSRAERNRVTR